MNISQMIIRRCYGITKIPVRYQATSNLVYNYNVRRYEYQEETLAKVPEETTTPYSDKYYQPIISQGFRGFDKLVIPPGFLAKNQEIELVDEDAIKQQKELQETIAEFKTPIKVSIGYGSGVFSQDGYIKQEQEEPPQLDFINVVENNELFHKGNLQQFPSHYPIKSPALIKLIQGANGIYFNPFIQMHGKLIKYGIISTHALMLDLSEWTSLYFAGRLHKPVNFIKDEGSMVKFLNQYNLKNATTLSILLIEGNLFSEVELYEQITRISYLGDFRMYVGGENPNKVKNIVNKQLKQFNKLYEPILDYLLSKNILAIAERDDNGARIFRKNLTVNNKINLISTLPLQFRIKLYQMYRDKSIKEIVKDKDLSKSLIKIVMRTIQISSLKQAIRGVFSSGLLKSIRYALAKLAKFWRGKFIKT